MNFADCYTNEPDFEFELQKYSIQIWVYEPFENYQRFIINVCYRLLLFIKRVY